MAAQDAHPPTAAPTVEAADRFTILLQDTASPAIASSNNARPQVPDN
jgi:hypothetical protein